jgi:hypothetical protein
MRLCHIEPDGEAARPTGVSTTQPDRQKTRGKIRREIIEGGFYSMQSALCLLLNSDSLGHRG